jgi:hypothetical protein
MEGIMPKWEHLVAGAAIHLLGPNQTCSCKASHHSSHGPDERLRAVNAKLLEALENMLVNPKYYSAKARAAIEEARK